MKHLFFLLLILLPLSGHSQQQGDNIIKLSDDISLIKLSDKAYVHISVTEIGSFGKVASNGLILIDNGDGILFDTPVTNEQTQKLVEWVKDSLNTNISKFIPNHWHKDCMGGLEYLNRRGIESYANKMTIDIAREKGLPMLQHSFKDSLLLHLNSIQIECYYLGAGHALDNIVVWIPSEKILFPGCMIKDIHSQWLGNIADGDVKEWPNTILKVMQKFPEARVVIPGHGATGGMELVEHTYNLLKAKE